MAELVIIRATDMQEFGGRFEITRRSIKHEYIETVYGT